MRHDARRKLTTIKGFAFAFGDQAQRFGLRWIAEEFTGQRRAAARHEMLGIARLRVQFRDGARPLTRDDRRHHEAALGDVNGGRKQISKRQLAITL